MKVLVTGCTGFLGLNIQKHIGKHLPHHKIFGVGSGVYDLRCQQACQKVVEHHRPDVIVHAAGTVGGIGANKSNPGKFMYENLIMGANMIEAARKKGNTKFVMIGTVCSYPKHTPTPFCEEHLWVGHPEETNAPYGIAKKTLMKLLEAYHEQYGMNCVNLIPVNMYGPHDHFNLTSSHVIPALILKFYDAIQNGKQEVEVWGTGKACREFLFVEDCVEAIALAVKNDVGPEPINIGTGKEISIYELVEKIGTMMGYDGYIRFDSDKPDGQPRRCLNTMRAQERLGFRAKTGLKDGLKETIEWFYNDNNWSFE